MILSTHLSVALIAAPALPSMGSILQGELDMPKLAFRSTASCSLIGLSCRSSCLSESHDKLLFDGWWTLEFQEKDSQRSLGGRTQVRTFLLRLTQLCESEHYQYGGPTLRDHLFALPLLCTDGLRPAIPSRSRRAPMFERRVGCPAVLLPRSNWHRRKDYSRSLMGLTFACPAESLFGCARSGTDPESRKGV